jgi:hypothetical protein
MPVGSSLDSLRQLLQAKKAEKQQLVGDKKFFTKGELEEARLKRLREEEEAERRAKVCVCVWGGRVNGTAAWTHAPPPQPQQTQQQRPEVWAARRAQHAHALPCNPSTYAEGSSCLTHAHALPR